MADRYAVVAAVDGSPSSHAAVTWAAVEAARRETSLFVVHICEAEANGMWSTPTLRATLRELSKPVVDEAVSLARAAEPGLQVEGHVMLGSASRMLVAMSDRSDLVVVGRTGRGALAAHLLGSITARLVAHAHCPVVAVPVPPKETVTYTDIATAPGRVLVGIADRVTQGRALDFGIGEAAARHSPLLAVRAWHGPVRLPLDDGTPVQQPAFREREELDEVNRMLSGHLRDRQIPATGMVRAGQPAAVLTSLCEPSDLLVLGQHRHGNHLPATAGHVISECLHRAPCPVAVVPEPELAPIEQESPRVAESAGLIAY